MDLGYNDNLNAAFRPKWRLDPNGPAPGTDTRIDPFLGTGWDRWLDAAGAGAPGGVKMQMPSAALGGLRRAATPVGQVANPRAKIEAGKVKQQKSLSALLAAAMAQGQEDQ